MDELKQHLILCPLFLSRLFVLTQCEYPYGAVVVHYHHSLKTTSYKIATQSYSSLINCIKTSGYSEACLTWPVLSVGLACGDDTAYSKMLGPPQTHADSAGGSPEDGQQQSHFAVVEEVLRSFTKVKVAPHPEVPTM